MPTSGTDKTAANLRGLIFIGPLLLTLYYLGNAFLSKDSLSSYSIKFWLINLATIPICAFGISTTFSDTLKQARYITACFVYSGVTLADLLITFFQARNWDGPWFDKISYILGLPFGDTAPWVYLHDGIKGKFDLFTSFLNFASIPLFIILAILILKNSSNTSFMSTNQFQFSSHSTFNFPPESQGVQMTINNNSNAQWVVKMPGQPDNSVDTATLQMWARSGVIRPDTLIVEVSTGMSWQASQINGIFSSKSYVTALLLSFFLGYLGVDRFYLGHTGIGIGKLLTFGGCGIWSLIDFILIAARKVPDSQGNPLA